MQSAQTSREPSAGATTVQPFLAGEEHGWDEATLWFIVRCRVCAARMGVSIQTLFGCDYVCSVKGRLTMLHGPPREDESPRLRVSCAQVYKGSVSEGNVAYPTVGKSKPAGRADDLPSAPPLPQVGLLCSPVQESCVLQVKHAFDFHGWCRQHVRTMQ